MEEVKDRQAYGDWDPFTWRRGHVRWEDLADVAELGSVLDLWALMEAEEEQGIATEEEVREAQEDYDRVMGRLYEKFKARYVAEYYEQDDILGRII